MATRQATYNAALGSRALHAIQTHGAVDQTYDNNAYALAWTYHGGTLKAYTNHPIPPSTPRMRPGYTMKQLKGWSLTSDISTFRQGATAYRNGRDWAKLQRDQAITKANEMVTDAVTTNVQHQSPASEDCSKNTSHITSNEPSLTSYPTTDTSEDELSLEFLHPAKRPRSLIYGRLMMSIACHYPMRKNQGVVKQVMPFNGLVISHFKSHKCASCVRMTIRSHGRD